MSRRNGWSHVQHFATLVVVGDSHARLGQREGREATGSSGGGVIRCRVPTSGPGGYRRGVTGSIAAVVSHASDEVVHLRGCVDCETRYIRKNEGFVI